VLNKSGQIRRADKADKINRQPLDRLAVSTGDCGEGAPFMGREARVSRLLPAMKRVGDREDDTQCRE